MPYTHITNKYSIVENSGFYHVQIGDRFKEGCFDSIKTAKYSLKFKEDILRKLMEEVQKEKSELTPITIEMLSKIKTEIE